MVNRTVMGVISVAIFVLMGVAMGPTITSSVADINATTLSGIPLASVIVLLATYLPTFYYLALVIGGIGGIWWAIRFGGND